MIEFRPSEQELNILRYLKMLQSRLVPEGGYSICRSDGKPMGLGEQMDFGNIFARIDEWIDICNEDD